MTAAQDRITREGESLRAILKDHPEVRRHVEQAYRRGYSHGVYNYRDNIEQGCTTTAINKWTDDVFEWRYKQSRERVPGYLGNWPMPPVIQAMKVSKK
jgi:hypothetical protein